MQNVHTVNSSDQFHSFKYVSFQGFSEYFQYHTCLALIFNTSPCYEPHLLSTSQLCYRKTEFSILVIASTGRYTPRQVHPQPGRNTPSQAGTTQAGTPSLCPVYAGIRSTSGRYASHWNAILLFGSYVYKCMWTI